MGDVSQALGQGALFEYRDVKYTVSPWTYDIQGKFEMHLKAEARKAYRELAPHLEPEEKKELLAQLNRDLASGVYTFGSQEVANAMRSIPHLKQLFWLMLRPNHPDVKPELAADMVRDKLAEVFDAMTEANADPTRPRTTPPGETPTAPPS